MEQPPALALDREYALAVEAIGEPGKLLPSLPVGDIAGRRQRFNARIQRSLSAAPPTPNIDRITHQIPTADGTTITLHEFRPRNAPLNSSPAIYHVHGGGMLLGSVSSFAPTIAARASSYNLPIFSIDYRLAPENPHPIPVNDCYAGLTWLSTHAHSLGLDPTRLMVLGESAGGGLAAGTVIMARHKRLSPPVAYQMLIYPMLDDRNLSPRPGIEPYTKWRADDNKTGWGAVLGSAMGLDAEVEGHQYAAPARVKSVEGLPPTYIDVGGLDYFLHEDIDYATRLLEAGIAVELHVYPGLPHDFEWAASSAKIVRIALDNRQRVVEEFKL